MTSGKYLHVGHARALQARSSFCRFNGGDEAMEINHGIPQSLKDVLPLGRTIGWIRSTSEDEGHANIMGAIQRVRYQGREMELMDMRPREMQSGERWTAGDGAVEAQELEYLKFVDPDGYNNSLMREREKRAAWEAMLDQTGKVVTNELLFAHYAHLLEEASPGSTIPKGRVGYADAVEMPVTDDQLPERWGSVFQHRMLSQPFMRTPLPRGKEVVPRSDHLPTGLFTRADLISDLTARSSTNLWRHMSGKERRRYANRLNCCMGTAKGGRTGSAVTGEHLAHKLAEASPGSTIDGGGGSAHAFQMPVTDDQLPVRGSTSTPEATERLGSQARAVDEAGGSFISIAMGVHDPPQNDQPPKTVCNTIGCAVPKQDGGNQQNVMGTVFGGLVVLAWTALNGSSKGEYPAFVKILLRAGFMVMTVLAYAGVTRTEIAKAAMRTALGISLLALSVQAAYEISEDFYIRCIIGVTGAVFTSVLLLLDLVW